MKKRMMIVAVTLLGLLAVFVILYAFKPSPLAARPVRLVITGPAGEQFSGTYTADGVTHSVTAIAPATLGMQARNVDFAFTRSGGGGEFRVELYVGENCRTSTTSAKQPGVRGQLRYAADSESYWAAGF